MKATIALHYVMSILNPMYIPYALVYFVDRVYIACNMSSACANLSFINYMTEEIIVMIVSVILHIPIWSLCLRIVDIKKNGGKINDMWRRKVECEETVPAEECVGEFEDDDVKMERERVLNMCSGNSAEDALQPVVIVKVLTVALITKHENHSQHHFRTYAKSLSRAMGFVRQCAVRRMKAQTNPESLFAVCHCRLIPAKFLDF